MRHQLKLLLVDFDGVMSNGRFYNAEDEEQAKMGVQAVQHIFAPGNSELLNDWMRGKLSYQSLHDLVEKKAGLSARQLDALLEESVKRMSLNQALLRYIGQLRSNGVVVSLFTNNMDVFDKVSRAHHKLDTYFDHIYSSSEQGQLKLEDDTLLLRVIQDAGTGIAHTAFVDDSTSSYEAATSYGVATCLYKDYTYSQKLFEAWLHKQFIIHS